MSCSPCHTRIRRPATRSTWAGAQRSRPVEVRTPRRQVTAPEKRVGARNGEGLRSGRERQSDEDSGRVNCPKTQRERLPLDAGAVKDASVAVGAAHCAKLVGASREQRHNSAGIWAAGSGSIPEKQHHKRSTLQLTLQEVIHRRGPWRSFDAVEFATLEWVEWFNNRRLLEPNGNIPPAEAEEHYYATLDQPAMAA